jgi:hypothetical protein
MPFTLWLSWNLFFLLFFFSFFSFQPDVIVLVCVLRVKTGPDPVFHLLKPTVTRKNWLVYSVLRAGRDMALP